MAELNLGLNAEEADIDVDIGEDEDGMILLDEGDSELNLGLEAPPEDQDMPERIGKLEAGTIGAAQGLTWGNTDEILSGIEAAFSGKSYARVVKKRRERFAEAEKQHPELYTGAEIASTIVRDGALMFVPGLNVLRSAKILHGVAVGAADGALTGWGASEDTFSATTAKNVAMGAGFGAVAVGAIAGISKGVKAAVSKTASKHPAQAEAMLANSNYDAVMNGGAPPSPKDLAAQAGFFEEGTMDIWKNATRITSRNAREGNLLKKGPDNWDSDFINWNLGKPQGTKVGSAEMDTAVAMWDGMNKEGQSKTVQNYMFGKAMLEAQRDFMTTSAGKKMTGGIEDPLESKFWAKVRAPSQNADLIDHKLRTNVRGDVISAASKAQDMTMQLAAPFLKRQYDLNRVAKKAGLKEETITGWLKGEPPPGITPPQQKVLDQYRTWFDDARGALQKAGLQINDIPDYLPRMTVNAVDSRVKMQNMYRKISAGKATPEEQEQFTATARYLWPDLYKPIDDIAAKIEKGTATPKELAAPKQPRGAAIQLRIKKITADGKAGKGELPEAFAVFSRKEGNIPTLLQEGSIDKLMSNYILFNAKAHYMRDPLQKLQNYISLFRGMELDNTAKIYEDYFAQLTSSPGNKRAMYLETSARLKVAGEEMIEKGGLLGKFGGAVKNAPEFAAWMGTQIYPNYLGWNLHAPLRNMTQTWMVTAPELKGPYGYSSTFKGWARASRAMKSGTNPGKFLDEKGLRAPEHNNEGYISNFSDDMGALGTVGRAVDWGGKKGLTLYAASDSANRFITYHIAQQVGEDILKGSSKGAQKFLSSVRAGPRQQLEMALESGNKEEFMDTLTTYLIDKTQFKYTRADLSQFGREYGAVLSMFSKWPTMIIGDMEHSYKTQQGVRKILEPMQKYMAPLMLLQGAKQFLEQDGEMDPKLQLFLGRDLANWSPTSAVLGIQTPPIPSMAVGAYNAFTKAAKGEIEAAGKELGKAGQPFTPGLYTWKLGERVKTAID